MQFREQGRIARIREVLRGEQQVFAGVEAIPKLLAVNLERSNRGVDRQMRKTINLRAEGARLDSHRMLIVGNAELHGGLALESRHMHAVVIDQLEGELVFGASGHQQDVAVLQVAMGHLRFGHPLRQAQP